MPKDKNTGYSGWLLSFLFVLQNFIMKQGKSMLCKDQTLSKRQKPHLGWCKRLYVMGGYILSNVKSQTNVAFWPFVFIQDIDRNLLDKKTPFSLHIALFNSCCLSDCLQTLITGSLNTIGWEIRESYRCQEMDKTRNCTAGLLL